ncbi:hypothetical protein PL321_16695 [Caloramator sp. mosi_1]|nr:hypothetical protein [Caloramator sp. mosi_1]WDC83993.1 hypothetical protein PL321_16695 [Caloramator sp. mosi_1]
MNIISLCSCILIKLLSSTSSPIGADFIFSMVIDMSSPISITAKLDVF